VASLKYFIAGKKDRLSYKKCIVVGITTTDVAQHKAIYKLWTRAASKIEYVTEAFPF
jgi:hypothetical protein